MEKQEQQPRQTQKFQPAQHQASQIYQNRLTQKQEFLRINVDTQDYDQFTQFCMKEVGNLDIDTWSIDQVHKLVAQFRKYKSQEKDKTESNKEIDPIVPSENQPTFLDCLYQFERNTLPFNSSDGIKEQLPQIQTLKSSPLKALSMIELSPQVENHSRTVLKDKTPIREQKQQEQFSFSALELIDLLENSNSNSKAKSQVQIKEFNSQLKNTKNQNYSSQIVTNKQQNKQQTKQKSQQASLKESKRILQIDLKQSRLIKQKQEDQRQVEERHSIKIVTDPHLVIEISPSRKNLTKSKMYQNHKEQRRSSLTSSYNLQQQALKIPKIYKEEFQDIIKCRKLPNLPTVSVDKVSIKKHQIIHRAFFLPDYVMYHVDVQFPKIICKRNYEDFSKLRQSLCKFYPGVKIPYLETNSWLSETNIEFINKQKVSLQFFLNEILSHKTLQNSTVVQQFLSLTDHKSIKRKFQQYQSREGPVSIQQLYSQTGNIKVKMSNSDHFLITKAHQLTKETQAFFAQYSQASQSAINNYSALISNFRNMTKLLENIRQKTKQFQKYSQSFKIDPSQHRVKDFSQTLKIWQQLCVTEYKQLKEKKECLLEGLQPFLQYQQMNLSTIDSILTDRTELENHYIRQFQSQSISPSTSLNDFQRRNSHSVVSSRSNLPYVAPQLLVCKKTMKNIFQCTQNIQITKYHLAFMNTVIKQQLQTMFGNLGNSIKNKWLQQIKKYLSKDENIAKIDLYKSICQCDYDDSLTKQRIKTQN